jgi:hypothetical protein
MYPNPPLPLPTMIPDWSIRLFIYVYIWYVPIHIHSRSKQHCYSICLSSLGLVTLAPRPEKEPLDIILYSKVIQCVKICIPPSLWAVAAYNEVVTQLAVNQWLQHQIICSLFMTLEFRCIHTLCYLSSTSSFGSVKLLSYNVRIKVSKHSLLGIWRVMSARNFNV